MFKKLKNIFSDKSSKVTIHDMARAIYFVFLLNGNEIIKSILKTLKETHGVSEHFKIFLAADLSALMCLISTKETYGGFITDEKEAQQFSLAMLDLFKNHMKFSIDLFYLYLNYAQSLHEQGDNPDKVAELFASRMVFFANPNVFEDEFQDNYKSIPQLPLFIEHIKWHHMPQFYFFMEQYVNIFKMILDILKDFFKTNKYSDKKIKELANEFVRLPSFKNE